MITLGAGLHRDVPMDVYHGDCCPGSSVSGSVLTKMRDKEGCPAKAVASHYLSPWPREDDDTEDKTFGRAAHTFLIEGKEAFNERYVIKPEDFDGRTKEGKAWKVANADREIIAFAAFEKITRMQIGLLENEGTAHAFTDGEAEVTAIIQDKETGLWLKVRPDWLRPKLVVNYKTAKSAAQEPFMRQVWNLGYHIGAALAVDVLRELGHPVHYGFLAQEKTVPYLAKMWVLTDDFLVGGRMEYRLALRAFADSVASGKWAGYGHDVGTLPLPPWADRKLANMESPT